MRLASRVFRRVAISLPLALAPVLRAQTVYWDGDGTGAVDGGTGTWSNSTGNKTWSTSSGGSTYAGWTSGADAIFQNTAGTVTVSGGVTVGDLTFGAAGYLIDASVITLSSGSKIDTNAFDAAIDSKLHGSGVGFTKNGNGTLTLTNANNDYTGTTTFNNGIVLVSTDANLGVGGGLVFNGGVLKIDTTGFISSRAVTLSPGGGAINVVGTGTSSTFSGVIGDVGQLHKTGSGTLILSGANTYSGGTSLDTGKLSVSANNNLGASSGGITFAGGTLLYTAGFNFSRVITFSTGGGTIDTGAFNPNWTGTLSGSTGLEKLGSGRLTLSAANTGYSGDLTVTAGILRATGNTALGTGTVILGGGELDLRSDSALTIANTVSLGTDATIDSSVTTAGAALTHSLGGLALGAHQLTLDTLNTTSGTAGLTVAGNTTLATGAILNATTGTLLSLGGISPTSGANASFTVQGSGNTTIGGVIATGTGSLTKSGAGTLTLSAPNIFTGGIVLGGGILNVSADSRLGGAASGLTFTGGTLQLGAAFDTARAVALSSGGGTINTNGFNSTFSGLLSGSTALTKSGSGTLTLSNSANTYTGTLTLSAGTLNLTNSTALASATLSVSSGATTTFGTPSGTTTAILGGLAGGGTVAFPSEFGKTLTLTVGGNNADTTFDGLLSTAAGSGNGFGDLVKTGSGTLTLTNAANSFAGATNIIGGLVKFSSLGNFGATGYGDINLYAGGLQWAAGTTTDISSRLGLIGTSGGVLQIDSGSVSFANGLNSESTASTLTKTGNGTLALTVNNSNYKGTVSVSQGALRLDTGGALANATLNAAGGSVLFGPTVTSGRVNGLSGSTDIALIDTAGTPASVNLIVGGGSVAQVTTTYSGALTGNGSLSLDNDTTLTLNGTNTFTGGLSIDNGATLHLGNSGAVLADTLAVTVESGTLALGTSSETIGTLAGATSGGSTVALGNSTLTLAGAANTGFAGAITSTSASGGIAKTGAGTLSLSGDNTFSGPANISAGTLNLASSTALKFATLSLNGTGAASFTGTGNFFVDGLAGSQPLVLSNTATGAITLVVGFFGNGTSDYSGAISGLGGLTKTGSGTLTLRGDNSFSGNLLLQNGTLILAGTNNNGGTTTVAGTLQIGTGSNTGSISGNITDNGIVIFNRSDDITFNSNITSNSGGRVVQNGGGKLTLSGANTYTGGTTLHAGILAASSDGNLGSTAGALTFTGGSLQLGASFDSARLVALSTNGGTIDTNGFDAVFSGAISGSTMLVKAGDGTLTLSSSSNNSAQLDVSRGVVALGKSSTANAVANIVSIASGATVKLTGSGSDQITNSASTGLNGVTGTFDLNGRSETVGQFTGSAPGVVTNSSATPATFTVGFGGAAGAFSGVLQDGAGTLALAKIDAGTLTLSGPNTYTGGTTVSGGTLAAGASNVFADTGALLVNGGEFALGANSDTVGAVTVQSGSITGSTGVLTGSSYDVQTGSISAILAGSGVALTKTTGGTVLLSGANTYTGGTTLVAGTLALGNARAIGTGTLTLAGGTLDNTSGSALTLSTNNPQAWNGDFTFTGTDSLDLGTGAVTLGAPRTVTVTARSLTVDGAIGDAGHAYSLSKDGGGTLTLTGANTFTGGITVNSGILAVSADGNFGGAAGGLTLAGGTLQLGGSFDTARAVALSTGGGTIDTNGFDSTFSGVLSGTALTKTGSGTLTLTGANAYSGTLTIAAGTLAVATDAALGSATSGLTFAGGTLQLGTSFNTARNLTFSTGIGTIDTNGFDSTFSGVLSGTGALAKEGGGTLTLSGLNTFSGGTSVSAGVLVLGNSLALQNSMLTALPGAGLSFGTLTAATLGGLTSANALALTNASAAGVALTIGQSGLDSAYSGVFSGTGSITKTGAGTLTLSGDNSYSGGTTISAGTLQLGAGGTSGSITGNVTDNASLAFNRSDALTFAGIISGTGSVTQTGTGTLTLSGANTYAGATLINAGALNIQQATALGTAAAGTTVANNAALELQGGVTISSEALSLNGTGVSLNGALRNISGANTYNGAITLAGATEIQSDAGTLTLGGGITGTAGLTFDGSGATTVSGIIGTGSGSLTKTGAGTLTLSGANTFTGATTISGGSLVVGNALALQHSTLTAPAAGALTFGTLTAATLGGLTGSNPLALLNSADTPAALALTVGSNNADTIYSGALSGSGSLIKSGTGTLTLSGQNTYSGATTISAGTLQLGATNAVGSAGAVTIATGAIFDLHGFDDSLGSLAGAGTVTSNTAGSVTLTVGANNSSTTFSGVVQNGLGVVALSKTGTGTLTLSGTNTYTGDTTISGGTLTLDFTNPATPSNVISSSSRLVLAGGTLDIAGTPTGTTSQTFASTTLVGGASSINLVRNGGTAFTLNLNALTRTTGATLNLSTLDGGANVSATLTNGIVGGWLTNNSSDFFTSTASLVSFVTNTWAAGKNTSITASDIVPSGSTTNSLRFNDSSGAKTLTLSGTNTITSGGLLVTAAVGNNTTTITGGILRGATDADLIVFNYNLASDLTIASSIADHGGATGLTKSGDGTLVLSGANTYTGTTVINAGTLRLAGGHAVAGSGSVTLADVAGATLDLNNTSETIGALGGGGLNGGNIVLGSATLTTNASSNTTFAGVISGTGSLIKEGTGSLTLTGTNTFTGGTTLLEGTLQFSSRSNFGTGSISLGFEPRLQWAPGNTADISSQLADFARPIFDTNGNDVDFATPVAGAYLLKEGGGTLTLAAGSSIGSVSLRGGTLALSTNISPAGNAFPFYFEGGILQTTASFAIGSQHATMLTALGGTFQTDAGTTFTYGGQIYGAGNLAKTGPGTLVLSGAGLNTGITTVAAGTLQFAQKTALYSNTPASWTAANLVVNSGATAAFNVGGAGEFTATDVGTLAALGTTSGGFKSGAMLGLDTTNATAGFNYSGVIANPNASTNVLGLVKLGTGTLTLSGANTYTGATFVNAGALNVQHATALGTAAAGTTIANGAALELQGNVTIASETLTLNGTGVSNNGALRNISGANTYAGPITLASSSEIQTDAGTLTLGSGGITGAFDLTFDGSSNTTVSGVVGTGSGALTKTGSGTLTLSGANTYTGGTTISGGTLILGHALALQNSTLTTPSVGSVSFGTLTAATLGGLSGSNNLALLNSAITPAAVALTVGNNNAATTYSGVLSSSGSLIKTGTSTLTLSGANTFTGGTTISAGTLAISANGNLGAAASTVTFNGGSLQATASLVATRATTLLAGGGTFNVGSGLTLTWLGNISGHGDLTKLGIGTLLLGDSNTANSYGGTTFINGGTLKLGGAGALSPNTTLQVAAGATFDANGFQQAFSSLSGAGNVSVGSAGIVVTQTGATSFTGMLSGIGGLTFGGTGTLTLGNAANSYGGATTLNGGTLTLGATGGLPTGTALQLSAGATLNLAGYAATIKSLTGLSGTVLLGGGGLTVAQTVSDTTSFGGSISGTGTLTKSGSGSLTLTGANTYSGITTISQGTLQIGGSSTTGTLGTGAVIDNAALAFNRSNSLDVSNAISGTGTLTQIGTGVLTLSGDNTYTGALLVSAGTIKVGSNAALGIGSAVTLSASGTLDLGALNPSLGSLAGSGLVTSTEAESARLMVGSDNTSTTFSGVIQNGAGTTSFSKSGTGTLTLTGASTYTSRTTVNQGVLEVSSLADGGVASSIGAAASDYGFLLLNGTLRYIGPTASTDRRFMVGTSGATLDASGSGALTFSNTGAINSDFNGGDRTLTLAGTNTGANTFAASISDVDGVVSVAKSGPGTWILTGDSTHTGGTIISGGTLQIGAGDTSGSIGGNIANGAALVFNRSDVLAYGGIISGSGRVAQSGAGTLTLSGINTYTGATTVDTGMLVVDGSIAASSRTTVSGSGVLGGHGTVGALTIGSGGTLAPGNSPGTLSAGDTAFESGGSLIWEVNNATGTPGSDPGWDLLAISGALTLNATSGNPFTLDLTSLTLANTAGLAANFDPASNYSFTFLTTTNGVNGFAADKFRIATAHFENPFTGTWSVGTTNGGLNLSLNYSASVSAVPEPGTYAFLAGLAALALAAAAKRRRV